jgi:serine protease
MKRVGDGIVSQEKDHTPIVVKFNDAVDIPYEDDAGKHLEKLGLGSWIELEKRFPGIRMRRAFSAVSTGRLRELMAEAVRRDRTYKPRNLLAYFTVDCPTATDARGVVDALLKWGSVERAYVQPQMILQGGTVEDNNFQTFQGYLQAAPLGINAQYAWEQPGGKGEGQYLIDIETGWQLDHEDLVGQHITQLSGPTGTDTSHGTQVLGIICASHNGIGIKGIAPNSTVRVVSESSNIANDYITAISALPFGGVLLLEYGPPVPCTLGDGTKRLVLVPPEITDLGFTMIRLATALGITVIEGSHDGTYDSGVQIAVDLKYAVDNLGHHVLDPDNTAEFRDSLAILVSGSTSGLPHEPAPLETFNFGKRVDCYAWGESVYTTRDDRANPYGNFAGTSAAMPIIAGAVLLIQGIAEAKFNRKLGPLEMRDLLRDLNTGTHSKDMTNDLLGVMPNLQAIITNKLHVGPDVYLRDYVGDNGDLHHWQTGRSPDIILSDNPVPNPQSAFGAGSGTENFDGFDAPADINKAQHIYVRAYNRGSAPATGVTATVAWSEVATIITPDKWNFIGTATTNIPEGNILTVFPEILWPAAAISAPGNYSFLAFLNASDDKIPPVSDLYNWDGFLNFVSNNNNVSIRNFHVVDNTLNVGPLVDERPRLLPFIVTGALDRALMMGLDVEARLPSGSRVWLELPIPMYEAMQKYQPATIEEKAGTAKLPMDPQGRWSMGDIPFVAKSRSSLQLHVHIPERNRQHAYEIFASQTYKGEEVGRVTWRLVPPLQRAR